MSYKNFTDERIKKEHKILSRLCSVCEFGIRNGIKNKKFLEISKRAIKEYQTIQNEFFKRHPQDREARINAFLSLASMLFEEKNLSDYGNKSARYPDAIALEYFTEYNTPRNGEKIKTERVTVVNEKSECEQKKFVENLMMNENDYLFADLEAVLDEITQNGEI